MNFTIELTASPALLEAINNLTRAFCGNGAVQATTLPPAAAVANARSGKRNTTTPAPAVPVLNPPTGEPVSADAQEVNSPAETTTTATTPSIEDIRAAVREKGMAGKKEEAKALLEQFGVERIPDLPEEVRADFLAKVEAL